MAKVHIMQLLCPDRHCVMGSAYEEGTIEREQAVADFKAIVDGLVKDKIINPWCDICKSRNLQYEVAPSIFDDMEEAKKVIETMERNMQLSRLMAKSGLQMPLLACIPLSMQPIALYPGSRRVKCPKCDLEMWVGPEQWKLFQDGVNACCTKCIVMQLGPSAASLLVVPLTNKGRQ